MAAKLNKTENTVRDLKCNFLLCFSHFENKLILCTKKPVVLHFTLTHMEAAQLLYSSPAYSWAPLEYCPYTNIQDIQQDDKLVVTNDNTDTARVA